MSDKRGLVPFAQALVKLGFSIISTDGTLRALQAAGVPAQKVSDYTEMPEILGGRVKTLHPKIHGGILARPNLDSDRAELERHQLRPISLVAVNLYPFRQTVESGASFAEAIEQIDIGGLALVRAAAKNFAHVTVVVDPTDYDALLSELKSGAVGESTRRTLSRKAFGYTAAYDAVRGRTAALGHQRLRAFGLQLNHQRRWDAAGQDDTRAEEPPLRAGGRASVAEGGGEEHTAEVGSRRRCERHIVVDHRHSAASNG